MIKKMFVADAEEQKGGSIRKSVKTGLPQLLLKLADADGYNSSNEIRGPDGRFVSDTDVLKLATLACTPDAYIKGKKEFGLLLAQHGIERSSVLNDNIRRYMTGADTPKTLSRPPSPSDESCSRSVEEPPQPIPSPPPVTHRSGTVVRRIRRMPPPLIETRAPHEIPLPEPVANVPTKRRHEEEQHDIEKVFARDGYEAYSDD